MNHHVAVTWLNSPCCLSVYALIHPVIHEIPRFSGCGAIIAAQLQDLFVRIGKCFRGILPNKLTGTVRLLLDRPTRTLQDWLLSLDYRFQPS